MDEQGILYRYLPTELEPPAAAWSQLLKVLDDVKPSSFEKMNALEIPPPSLAWGNIALALDELNTPKDNTSFADMYVAMEIEPPAFVWEKIENSLDEEHAKIRSIGEKPKSSKWMVIGLAIAACITAVVFLTVDKFESQPAKQNNIQVALKDKKDNRKQNITSSKTNGEIQAKQPVVVNKDTFQNFAKGKIPDFNDTEADERALTLEKYKLAPVDNINTTNNMVASKIGKLKDANGKVIYRIGDYVTSNGYLAAIGPNGNSVMVSTKLANMIEFFREDSTKINNEEYLDKVMRESNIWRQKLINWRKKVNTADANPSQMNFIDPIDLINFLKENK